MDGTRKTAILLLSLDQVMAAEVLGRLTREKIERVTLEIAKAEHVTREQQESVLNEFKAAFVSRPLMHPSGSETARELLERTLDQSEVEPSRQRFEEQVLAGPFAFLHNRHPDDLRRLIEDEHPQTIALTAAQLPPSLAAQVLAGFAATRQADILGRLARLGPTDADVLAEIAELLKNRLGRMPVRAGGVACAAEIIRETTRSTSRAVLLSLDVKDLHLAETLRESLFSFQDVASLDDTTLGVVLQETDDCQWAVALKGCSETLRQRVFKRLSTTVSQALRDEMNSVGPLRLSEISAVQHQIAESILALEADGQIELPKKEMKRQKSIGGRV